MNDLKTSVFYDKLKQDIKTISAQAEKVVESVSNDGVYNYDSCEIKIPKAIQFEKIEESIIDPYLRFSYAENHGRINTLVVKTPLGLDQGKRTSFAETACALLLSKGYDAKVKYYVD